jgi:hypothetical protein
MEYIRPNATDEASIFLRNETDKSAVKNVKQHVIKSNLKPNHLDEQRNMKNAREFALTLSINEFTKSFSTLNALTVINPLNDEENNA